MQIDTGRGNIAVIVVSREVRKVPLAWRHPLDGDQRPRPLLAEEMPEWASLPADQVGLCVYETTTEGTPCTPVFPNTPAGWSALLDYCVEQVSLFADKMGTLEDWRRLLDER